MNKPSIFFSSRRCCSRRHCHEVRCHVAVGSRCDGLDSCSLCATDKRHHSLHAAMFSSMLNSSPTGTGHGVGQMHVPSPAQLISVHLLQTSCLQRCCCCRSQPFDPAGCAATTARCACGELWRPEIFRCRYNRPCAALVSMGRCLQGRPAAQPCATSLRSAGRRKQLGDAYRARCPAALLACCSGLAPPCKEHRRRCKGAGSCSEALSSVLVIPRTGSGGHRHHAFELHHPAATGDHHALTPKLIYVVLHTEDTSMLGTFTDSTSLCMSIGSFA